MVWVKLKGLLSPSEDEIRSKKSSGRFVVVGSCLKYFVLPSLLVPFVLYFYFLSQRTVPYEQCLFENYRQSLPDHFIRERTVDRSDRISHMASLNLIADQVEALYIQRITFGEGLAHTSSHELCKPIPIIFDCSSAFQECGGLGDRLKGLASTFYLALLTDSRFFYTWTFPTDVNNYFVATNPSLSSPADTARSLFGIKYVTMFEWWCMNWQCMRRAADVERTNTGNLPELWNGYSSVISHTNMAYWDLLVRNPSVAATAKRYSLDLLRQDEMFYIFIRLYFTRLSSFMEEELEPYRMITSKNETLFRVGVQLRIGNDTTWHEGARHNLAVVDCFVDRVAGKCEEEKRNGKFCLVFVTSDSENALRLLRVKFKQLGISTVSTNGTISHIDKPSGSWIAREFADDQSVIREHSRVFVDWYLLTKMDYLYIGRSGFSETAAFAGMVPTERMTVKDEPWCRFTPWSGEYGANLW